MEKEHRAALRQVFCLYGTGSRLVRFSFQTDIASLVDFAFATGKCEGECMHSQSGGAVSHHHQLRRLLRR